MANIESTPSKLVLKQGSLTLTFDKDSDKATLQQKVLLWNKKPIEFALSEIDDIAVKSDKDGLKDLEKACLANNARFTNWECDRRKMDLTAGGKALYMHCLPADITDVSCKAGEVSAEVFEQYRIPTYHEASYKPFIISALMFLARIKDPGAKLENMVASHLLKFCHFLADGEGYRAGLHFLKNKQYRS